MAFFLIALLIQILVATAVIFILKHKLDRELVEASLEKLHAAAFQAPGQIMVKSYKVLSREIQGHFKSIVRRKAADAEIIFVQDKALKGGVIIELPQEKIDFSLAGRLRNFWP